MKDASSEKSRETPVLETPVREILVRLFLLRQPKKLCWCLVMLLIVTVWKWEEPASRASANLDAISAEVPEVTVLTENDPISWGPRTTPTIKTTAPPLDHSSAQQNSPKSPSLNSQLRQGPWTLPLQRLIEAGKRGEEVADSLADLLECQPGMGDQLLQLLLEGGGTLHEKRALLVALGTALSLSPVPGELWADRKGCLEWAIELWIEGYEDLSGLDRWLWQVKGIDGDLAFFWMDQFLSDPQQYPEGSSVRQRWRKVVIEGLQSEIKVESPAWLDQWVLEWIDSGDPEFRQIALGVLGKVYSQADPDLRFQLQSKIDRMDLPWQLQAGKELLRHVDGDQLVSVLEDWAEFFIRHEFRGDELLVAFQRARKIRLDSILQLHGIDSDSESYRMWILYGALGGLDSEGEFPADWFQTLTKTARLDVAQGVRFLALRLCAMGWSHRPRSEFEDLVRNADVSVIQSQHAIDLLRKRP